MHLYLTEMIFFGNVVKYRRSDSSDNTSGRFDTGREKRNWFLQENKDPHSWYRRKHEFVHLSKVQGIQLPVITKTN